MLLLAYLDPGEDESFLTSGLGVFLFVFIGLTIWIALSFFIAKWAERKGQSFVGFLLLGLVVSPLIAAIAALIVGDRAPAATGARASGRGGGGDHLDRLKTLTELRDSGTLSEQEFEAEKARIMGGSAPRTQP